MASNGNTVTTSYVNEESLEELVRVGGFLPLGCLGIVEKSPNMSGGMLLIVRFTCLAAVMTL